LFFYSVSSFQITYAVNQCQSQSFDHITTIKHIIDGDTIITDNDEHIRLIGIDTPEMNFRTSKADNGALLAKNHLMNLLNSTRRVGMVYGEEKYDHYGRTLAHLFLEDGTNIQASMLSHGLATSLIYPPNLRYVHCYYEASQQSIQSKQGLWALTEYQPMDVEDLTVNNIGYRIILASILNIKESKRSHILQLTQQFSAIIQHSQLEYFKTMDINTLLGSRIQIQGEIYYRGGQYWISLRHPLDLKILSSVQEI
jgi:micrococcal nuclease